MIKHVYSDGGREKAGYYGRTWDCVVRAIAIVTGKDYLTVQIELQDLTGEDPCEHGVARKHFDAYLRSCGYRWVSTKGKMKLATSEVPSGRIVVRLKEHLAAVINRTVYDTFNPALRHREGMNFIYGYYTKKRRQQEERIWENRNKCFIILSCRRIFR